MEWAVAKCSPWSGHPDSTLQALCPGWSPSHTALLEAPEGLHGLFFLQLVVSVGLDTIPSSIIQCLHVTSRALAQGSCLCSTGPSHSLPFTPPHLLGYEMEEDVRAWSWAIWFLSTLSPGSHQSPDVTHHPNRGGPQRYLCGSVDSATFLPSPPDCLLGIPHCTGLEQNS